MTMMTGLYGYTTAAPHGAGGMSCSYPSNDAGLLTKQVPDQSHWEMHSTLRAHFA